MSAIVLAAYYVKELKVCVFVGLCVCVFIDRLYYILLVQIDSNVRVHRSICVYIQNQRE